MKPNRLHIWDNDPLVNETRKRDTSTKLSGQIMSKSSALISLSWSNTAAFLSTLALIGTDQISLLRLSQCQIMCQTTECHHYSYTVKVHLTEKSNKQYVWTNQKLTLKKKTKHQYGVVVLQKLNTEFWILKQYNKHSVLHCIPFWRLVDHKVYYFHPKKYARTSTQ